MMRPEFTRKQEEWLCQAIGDWYLEWKGKITNGEPHKLGIAKENLKEIVCGFLPNTFLEDLLND